MKRHGKLLHKIINYGNIELAHQNAKHGKAHYTAVQKVDSDRDKYLRQVQQLLADKSFTTSEYDVFKIYKPKKRDISRLPYYPDRIVQHALLNVIAPIWDKIFIYDVYSAIPGKGIHKAIGRLKHFLKDKANTQYCLQFDIAKFYPSVDHKILKQQIRRKIKCSDTLWLLDDIVDSPPGDKGIPIGNYTSQYFANIYLNWLDHWIKQELKCKYYIRYADDGVILSNSKDHLRSIQQQIGCYLNDNLALKFNPKTQVYPVNDRGIDFLGYRTFRDYILLRKKSAKKFKRKLKKIKQQRGKIPAQHIVSSIMSYIGWIQHCNGYNLLNSYIFQDDELLNLVDHASEQLNINNPIRAKYGI